MVQGPDGAYYISQLTGFPFEKGDANIWRVVPGQAPTVYASGLTNLTDLAFAPDGSLYAVEISTNGLLEGPIGSLVKVTPGASVHETVAGYDELLASLLQANLAQLSITQNEDVRKITAWAAIIAIPTAITGVYGMNFEYMPELTWRIGYPLVLVVIALTCVLLYRGFKRNGWL